MSLFTTKIRNGFKYLIKDPSYLFLYILQYFRRDYKCDANIITQNDVESAIHRGKSLLRLGDGEIALIHYNTSDYQRFSANIRNSFLDIISQYSEKSHFLLGVPLFINKTNRQLDATKGCKKRIWMPFKVTFNSLFNKNAPYFDAHLFYHNETILNIIEPYVATKKIIFVSHGQNIEDFKITELAKTLYATILCPEKSSFESAERVLNEIIETISTSNHANSEFVVLLSAGMLKTIIADDRLQDIQILDIGKGFEGYKRGVSTFTFFEQ